MALGTERGSNRPVRSIIRAMDAIERLARMEGDMGVVEIGQELRLPRSTAHRILATLAWRGYVMQDPKTERYRLTLRFVELGGLVQRQVSLCDQARPHLRRLVQSTGESAGLAAYDGLRVLLVDKVEDPDRLWPRLAVGAPRPLHATASGKAVLATLPADELDRLLGHQPLPVHTSRTVQTRHALDEQLASARRSRYTVEDGEHEEGVRGVAAPIQSKSATVGALEIVGPAVRLSLDRIFELARYVRLAAEELSLSLGHEPGAPA